MAKIFVSGHSGFKGTWLCHWLRMLGHNVCGYSLPQNILNKKELENAMLKFKPALVFHLAAQPLVLASYKEPLLTYQTNVIGTLNILEAARKCKSVTAFVNVTTDKVYENKESGQMYKESDPLGGFDMYSSSKACSEILSQSYSKSFLEESFLLATARSGNCIGGGDWNENRIVPDCIRAIYANKAIKIRNPNAIRPWQFVLEPLNGYILLGEKLLQSKKEFAASFNFGPSKKDAITVKEIAEKVVNFYGKGKIEIAKQGKNLHEANLLMLNNSKAKKFLGWKPKYSIDIALEKTVEWYKRFKAKENMEKFMTRQIEEYVKYE
ncbi:MAG: CDP-glucose 4,6-dehydratase [Fibromonadales bacterium]|nr:CDP-glucose 4,6-dehydratase [Fibromonadales bacterium]